MNKMSCPEKCIHVVNYWNFYVVYKIIKTNAHQVNHKPIPMQASIQFTLNQSNDWSSELSKLNNCNHPAVVNEQSLDKISIYYNIDRNSVDMSKPHNKSSHHKNSLLNVNDLTNRSFSDIDTKKEKSSSTSIQNLHSLQNQNKSLLSVNQLSHYVTIVILGFYFILSTIPYGIILSLQNNLTLKLNYSLGTKNDYLNDPFWIRFGHLREWVAIFRVFFMSNHCFNLFLYLLFNRLFRKTIQDIFVSMCKSLKAIFIFEESSSYL